MSLAEEHGIATATVVKALRILKREGLVVGSTGHGTFVAERKLASGKPGTPTAS
jgi:DNA-binding GntR family transcriptional regulator